MTVWFHRYRRMKLKMAAMTELNQALCEANIELTKQIEALQEELKHANQCLHLLKNSE